MRVCLTVHILLGAFALTHAYCTQQYRQKTCDRRTTIQGCPASDTACCVNKCKSAGRLYDDGSGFAYLSVGHISGVGYCGCCTSLFPNRQTYSGAISIFKCSIPQNPPPSPLPPIAPPPYSPPPPEPPRVIDAEQTEARLDALERNISHIIALSSRAIDAEQTEARLDTLERNISLITALLTEINSKLSNLNCLHATAREDGACWVRGVNSTKMVITAN